MRHQRVFARWWVMNTHAASSASPALCRKVRTEKAAIVPGADLLAAPTASLAFQSVKFGLGCAPERVQDWVSPQRSSHPLNNLVAEAAIDDLAEPKALASDSNPDSPSAFLADSR